MRTSVSAVESAWKNAHPHVDTFDNLLFVLDISNDIAYSSSTGYVAHGNAPELGTSGAYSITAIGDPSGIDWPRTPDQVFGVTVSE